MELALMVGLAAVAIVVMGTLILASISILIMEFAEVYVRAARKWLRGRVRDFLAAPRESRVSKEGMA